jgi:hypothetical protein
MKKDKCPICKNELTVHTVSAEDFYSLCMLPYTMPTPNGRVVNYHYKSWALSNDPLPYQEEFHVYPYVVKILRKTFENSMAIHKYDKSNSLCYVVEIPIIDLPWDDPDKVRNKLQTIMVFS